MSLRDENYYEVIILKRFTAILLALIMLLSFTACERQREDAELKYVFLFIGDGMSFNAVQLARDVLSAREGKKAPAHLSFTDFDSVGIFTNHDKTSFIPDSASSGTAMATGKKTDSGKIAQSSLGADLESIATLLKKECDMKVGIVTTANLNHATPGVFYAHSSSRYNYYEIGSYIAKSGFDFFAGGQLLDADGGDENLITMAEKGGYTVLDTREEILNIKDKDQKYLLIDPHCDSTGMMSFTIDREENAFSLSDYLEICIDTIDNENGFFVMCEGGRIDSALHANDAMTAVEETLAFSDAVGKALDFYEKHPDETLILVTGDHETGGLSLGYTVTQYKLYLENLGQQKLSYLAYDLNYATLYDDSTSLDTVLYDLDRLFGLDDLAPHELKRVENAFEKTVLGTESYTDEDYISYSTRTPLTVEAVRLVANRSGIEFSTFVHTAAPMVLWAKGEGEETFSGTYDNTDVYNKLYSLFFK